MSAAASPAADPLRRRRRGGAAIGWARAGLALAAALAVAAPQEARAEGDDDRPFGRGTLMPTFGVGAGGFFSDIANVSFGLGFNYYLVAGLSAGLSFSDTVLIYRNSFKARFPGIEDQLPTNIFDITPSLQYVFFRSRRFSPYVYAGVGPVFFNHGAGTFGQWVAGPGAYINVAGPLYVNLGVGFSGLFPTQQCQDALTYVPADPLESPLLLDLCSFRWGPQVGMVLAFGGGKRRREERRRQREEPYSSPPREPASNPMDEAVQPEPPPRTAPVETGPEGGPAPAEPSPEVAPPPADAGPEATPPVPRPTDAEAPAAAPPEMPAEDPGEPSPPTDEVDEVVPPVSDDAPPAVALRGSPTDVPLPPG